MLMGEKTNLAQPTKLALLKWMYREKAKQKNLRLNQMRNSDYEETGDHRAPHFMIKQHRGGFFWKTICGPLLPQPSSAEGHSHGPLASFPSLISISLSSLFHGDRLSSLVDLFG